MAETLFEELKRYVRFGESDQAALRQLAPHATPHFRRIAEEFYQRLHEHEEALRVFSGPEQVERLKRTLCDWMALLLSGPWDEVYYERRYRIGQVHVQVAQPQRYMFTAMNLIKNSLIDIGYQVYGSDPTLCAPTVRAMTKIVDIELAIMLEAYREAYVSRVQELERNQKIALEHQLAMSEARYAHIVEKSGALIVTADAAGKITLMNQRCEEILGVSREEALGKRWLELFIPALDRARLDGLRSELLAGGRVPPYEGVIPKSDGVQRRVKWHFTTLPTNTGPLLCAMGHDITEEHELGQRMRRVERLAALGTMAAGLAHEIRNPLNAAHLQLTVAKRRLARAEPDPQGSLEATVLAETELARLASLVDEFLQFAKPQALRMARGDLRATVETVTTLLAPEAAQQGVELVLAHGDAASLSFDDERIKQVLFNLIRNAVEAAGQGGRHVAVRLRRDAAALWLDVEDDGPGLPSPDAPIFEPFFTTKEGGTGLGLAIVHRIVTDHGGKVTVESQPARTIFSFCLPT